MAFRTPKIFLLVSVSALALSGCGWLGEDVASGPYTRREAPAVAATPAPPAVPVAQAAAGTWREPDKTIAPDDVAALAQAHQRIAELEGEVESLRNDMKMMMPALTRLANLPVAADTAAAALNDMQPAAGNVAGGEIPRIHRNYLQGDEFHDEPEAAMDAPAQMPRAAAPVTPSVPAVPPPAPSSSAGGMVPGAPVAVHPPPPPPPAIAPLPPSQQAALPAAAMPVAYTPPAIDVASIRNVRFGNHEGGKARVVIDLSAALTFKFDIDNGEKLMVVEIPGAVWDAGPVTRTIQDNPLVQSMTSLPDGAGGTRLVLQLRASAKILWSQAIPPAGGQGNRIVFDISSL